MERLLELGLSNAVAAAGLALVAAAVGCLCRRPAVVHSLWLLVLLKLLTPPLVEVPVPRPTPEPVSEAVALPASVEVAWQPAAEIALGDPEDDLILVPVEDVQSQLAAAEVALAAAVEANPEPAAAHDWKLWAAGVWLLGTAAWTLLALVRIVRFRRLLRHAEPAPAWLERQARRVAAQLGLDDCPPLRFVPGRLSPLLWGLGGRPYLLLPRGLWDRLDDDQRATLLAHELAHLRRGDHWVRALELVVTAVYWWFPVLWWARRELRQAEEECCDAWVVSVLPRAARAYAAALVETLDFLAETRRPLPIGASGLGHLHHLRRRLTMIMKGTTPRALTWSGLVAVVALGTVLLPTLPTFAQSAPRGGTATNPEQDRARAEINELRNHIEKMKAELATATKRLEEAQKRLATPPGSSNRPGPNPGQGPGPAGPHEEITVIIRTPDGKMQEYRLGRSQDVLKDVIRRVENPPPGGVGERRIEIRAGEGPRPNQPGQPGQPGQPSGVRPGQPLPGTGGSGGIFVPGPGSGGGIGFGGGVNPPGRTQEIERKLDQLMKEIESLRRELHSGPNQGGQGGGRTGGGIEFRLVPSEPGRPSEPRNPNPNPRGSEPRGNPTPPGAGRPGETPRPGTPRAEENNPKPGVGLIRRVEGVKDIEVEIKALPELKEALERLEKKEKEEKERKEKR